MKKNKYANKISMDIDKIDILITSHDDFMSDIIKQNDDIHSKSYTPNESISSNEIMILEKKLQDSIENISNTLRELENNRNIQSISVSSSSVINTLTNPITPSELQIQNKTKDIKTAIYHLFSKIDTPLFNLIVAVIIYKFIFYFIY